MKPFVSKEGGRDEGARKGREETGMRGAIASCFVQVRREDGRADGGRAREERGGSRPAVDAVTKF